MTPLKRAYPGRLIFDHLPKTAGQAVNAWLVAELGTGCVTPNLIGDHFDLIRKYGGLYSVISAHIFFNEGRGLDPRYQYVTLFRDPVDRFISWLFFVKNNHTDAQLPILRPAVIRFLKNEDGNTEFNDRNCYVEHFCRIEGNGNESDEQKIANAFSAIKKYDVVGLYDDIPQFLSELAALTGLLQPEKLQSVNVTAKRPQVEELSPALRERIVAMNQLDIRLFEEVVAWKKSSRLQEACSITSSMQATWEKHEKIPGRIVATPDIIVSSAAMREENTIGHGHIMALDIDFTLTREIMELEMGIHIYDSHGELAFGTNSSLLGQSHRSLQSGHYRVSHHVIADLPAGKYTAGFAFAEKLAQGIKELFWQDVMCEFEVLRPAGKVYAGSSYLPAGISLSRTKPAATSTVVTQHAGNLKVLGPLLQLAAGELVVIPVEVINCSDQPWTGDSVRPINLSYHWLNSSGEMLLFHGLCTAIPTGGFTPGNPRMAEMQVQVPDNAGSYILVLTLVQEQVAWFENKGFQAARQTITVEARRA